MLVHGPRSLPFSRCVRRPEHAYHFSQLRFVYLCLSLPLGAVMGSRRFSRVSSGGVATRAANASPVARAITCTGFPISTISTAVKQSETGLCMCSSRNASASIDGRQSV